jgi:predicted alpha/beta-fold hydrolase
MLSGFSMGGNLTLLYLGQKSEQVDSRICGAITYSVPCDLAGSADTLARPSRRIYMQRFLRDLHAKMEEKSKRFPGLIDITGFEKIRSFHEFDDRYTAPLHGFRDARDYWDNCSALWTLKDIRVPALMVNAADDPFLSIALSTLDQKFPNAVDAVRLGLWLASPEGYGDVPVGFVLNDEGELIPR